jgi:hypothetical protein
MPGDFYVRAECGDGAHQAVESELLKASGDDVGNPGVVRPEDGSLNLGQRASLDKVNDAEGQVSLHEGNLWV